MTTRRSLYLLQYGRGLAAIAVVAFHLSILLGDTRYLGRKVFHDLTWRGNLGVDFFFVLSGFIIFYAHERDIGQPQRLASYIEKRFSRLYPVYWIYVLGMCALLSLGGGSASSLPGSALEWLSTLLLVRFDRFELPITPAWSLIHEISFYLLFAVLILNRAAGTAILLAWTATMVVFGTYATEGARTAFNTYFSAFNLDFLVGIGAFYLWKHGSRILAIPLVAVGLSILAGSLIAELRGFALYYHPLAYALGFGLVIAGAAIFETSRTLPVVSVLKFLGDASYSIYLTHLAILGLSAKISIVIGQKLQAPDGLIYAACFVAALAGGSLAHIVVERPLVRLLRRRSGGSGLTDRAFVRRPE